MTAILIDTNVLVYLFDLAEPQKQEHALQVVRALELNQQGCLCVQNLSEFVRATTRTSTPMLTAGEAMQQAQNFIEAFPIYPLTSRIVIEAIHGMRDYSLAYYDAQIWACAKLHETPLIFSEDFQDGQMLEGVRFVNPFAENFELEKWV
jgi:predicted nucleic acid-binding protein